ncbi:MAG: mannitol dehydrogenase family protein [Croceibacterium sp.]
MRLAPETLYRIPAEVACFEYDRQEQSVGIVHFGIGAFHRAHQAWYTDLAMSGGDRDWMIAGISLRSGEVAAQINPQEGLYTLTERDSAGATTRAIGAVQRVFAAGDMPHAPSISVIAPGARVVTLTVTEKGYCRASDGSLDHSLAGASFYPHLAAAMRERMHSGSAGLTLLSCDNLSGNGDVLRRLMAEYISAIAPETLEWFEHECTCPNSMVDRIVPATTASDLDALEARLGLRDEAAVFTERFSQWVIEDRFAAERPGWERVGAQLVEDVAPYETAKLRMLNGAHSALAYLGLERGHTFVHEAVADRELRALVERLMRVEAAGSFEAAPEQDLNAYSEDLLARFENAGLQHRLIQIAMDGSEKIPQRWLETISAQRANGAECSAIITALAAWLRHVRGDARPVDDPRAELLARLWRSEGRAGIAQAVFGSGGVLSPALAEAELSQLAASL